MKLESQLEVLVDVLARVIAGEPCLGEIAMEPWVFVAQGEEQQVLMRTMGQSLTPLVLWVKTEVVELALKTRLKVEIQAKQKDAPSGVMKRVEEMEESRAVVEQWD